MPVDGSDTLDMMQISANFEGLYPDLIRFINLFDKSDRLLIIESLNATPQQSGGTVERNHEAGHIRSGGRFGAMNLIPSKVGADPKKIAVLAGLMVVAGYFYFSNSNSGGGPSSTTIASRTPATSATTATGVAARSSFRSVQQSASTREFDPL